LKRDVFYERLGVDLSVEIEDAIISGLKTERLSLLGGASTIQTVCDFGGMLG
jgi:hypothetical protein